VRYDEWGYVTMLRLRLPLLLLFCLLTGAALAVSLPTGSELIITDSRGEVVLGYGRVLGNRLELMLSERAQDFVMLILAPTGSVEVRQGRVDATGVPLLLDDAGTWQPLAALVSAADLRLLLRRVPEGTFSGRLEFDDDLLDDDEDRGRDPAPPRDDDDDDDDDNDNDDDDDDDDDDHDGDDDDDDGGDD
jgi:hypothetical protein